MSIKKLISEVLDISEDSIYDKMSPVDCGNWTSMKHFIMMKKIEDVYQIKFSFEEMKKIHCVSDINSILKEKGVSV